MILSWLGKSFILKRMFQNSRLRAVATLMGTTIGAGIFGLPFAIAQVGWGAGLLMLLGLGLVTITLNLAFGEVILRTKGDHQLSGYGGIYYGRPGKILGFLAVAIGVYGAMIAYTVQGGYFLSVILPFGSSSLFSLVFFAAGSLAVVLGLKAISEVELVLTALIISLVGILALVGWSEMSQENLQLLVTGPNWLVPYGVIMFALAGSAVVPEIEEILRQEHDHLRLALILGTLIPTIVYLLFVTLVLGVSGPGVSQDGVSGLEPALPRWVVSLGAVLGVLTMGTSFASLGYVLRELYFRDLGFSKPFSLTAALLPVVGLFILGARSFISILETTGILMGGLTGGLILALFVKAKRDGGRNPAYVLPLPFWGVLLLLILFVWATLARMINL